MNNILLDELPTSYEGYHINTSFRIGVQVALISEDDELIEHEKTALICELLFGDEDGKIEHMPSAEITKQCINWFMSGWFHDKNVEGPNNGKIMDYDIDQFRIYADFLAIYGIDLNTVDMHWWAFQGLLWNMPHEKSSFLQTIELRTKKPRKNASVEEKKAIEAGHKRYDLKQKAKEYTSEEIKKIDEFDKLYLKPK